MGILDLFRARETRMVTSIYGGTGDDGWTASRAGQFTGSAEALAITQACVGLIAGSIASLPAAVKRRTAQGTEVVTDHPVAKLIAEGVNERDSYFDFMERLVSGIAMRGNGAAEIVLNERGEVIALEPIAWDSASLTQLPSGRLALDYTEESIGGGPARSRRLLQGEFLHVKNRGRSKFYGESQLQRAAASVDMAMLTEDHARANWTNASNPGAVLGHEKTLSEGAAKRLKDGFMAAFGGRNKNRVAVLEEGLTYTPLPVIAPVDSEILASRQHSLRDICRAFGVPSVLVDSEDSSYNNVATLTRQFATLTLAPYVAKIEQEFSRTVFSAAERDLFLDIDLNALMRADPEARWASHRAAAEIGAMTVNEIRRVEGLNPIEGGDHQPAKAPEERMA